MPTALFSLWDKGGLTELAASLHARGWRLVASQGTARALRQAGLPVQTVAELTGEPEILGGRVKTLHPAIHAALLARPTQEDMAALRARGWEPIDLVAVNLYPFEKTVSQPGVSLDEALESIDIGGVALLRAAAKNFARVTVLCDPADYAQALDPPDPAAFRLRMARKAFALCAAYDAAIDAYLASQTGEPEPLRLACYPALQLRYGENPHQAATFYAWQPGGTPLGGQLLQGKPLSYNNLLDLEAAWRAVLPFEEAAVVVVKHLSPCGVAVAPHPAEAAALAIACDPLSAFGSVIACNRPVDLPFVESLGDLFLECLAAPGFDPPARQALAKRKNLRLLQVPLQGAPEPYELRSVLGGLLRQTADLGDPPAAGEWQVVTQREPSEAEMAALRFAWLACQPVKSNAVLLARAQEGRRYSVGIGGGQPNRVASVRLACQAAGQKARGAVMASDAFFPFPDGVQVAAQHGVSAVVQPGGSVRDGEVIRAADQAGLAMVFTGTRHLRH